MTSPIRRIIIVDDHDAIRRGVRQLVETKPYYQVAGEAKDGRSALELAKQTRPDIAIIDYSVPELNGLDLSHALRRELPRIEILLYTMHDREEIVMEVLRAGVRGFVLKSDTEEHLLAALDALSIHRPYCSYRSSLKASPMSLRAASPIASGRLSSKWLRAGSTRKSRRGSTSASRRSKPIAPARCGS